MTIDTRFFIGRVIKTDHVTSRVRVNIFGEHDELTEEDQTQLPWSNVMFPNTGAGLPGNGASLGLKVGSTVFGLYVNESDTIILGCIQSSSVKNETPVKTETPNGNTNSTYQIYPLLPR
tara:strand:+ start:371 stop:727 length:357 start_codon:yes stop_codon:yes gene_type:complete